MPYIYICKYRGRKFFGGNVLTTLHDDIRGKVKKDVLNVVEEYLRYIGGI
jgi:hypothetical protein